MKNDLFFLEEAYKEALKAFYKDEVPVGAVVVKDNKIIGRGHNLRITGKNALYHAEIVAIEDACRNLGNWRLDGCSIYVTNEPCLMCAGAIMHSRISRVVFGSLNEKMGAVLSRFRIFDEEGLPFKVCYTYVQDHRCEKILKDFFSLKRGRLKDEKIFPINFCNNSTGC